MEFNTTVEFNEKEKESLRIVRDIIKMIENHMGSMGIVEDIYGNNFSDEDISEFEELLDSLKDKGINIREEEK